MSGKKLGVELSNEEALVLFEFLSRFAEDEKLEIIDQAEKEVLMDVLASLERELVEPFANNYKEILEEARRKVRDRLV
jgi:hypothetical protein